MLIVDDDTAVLRIIREALQSFLHWEVDTSPKPEYGFELALKKTYDLMIFDFSMPMIDGTLLFLLISKVYENTSPAAEECRLCFSSRARGLICVPRNC